jgi:hypothetical protein
MLLFSVELFFIEAIIFSSVALFIYWAMRALLLLVGSEEQIAQVLDEDLWWGRRFLLTLGVLMTASFPSLTLY